jgi:hypothetical protein
MALRREERPDEGYWKEFLSDFHQRQREEALKKSGLIGKLEDASNWFSNLGPSKWAYGAGLAYAAVTVGFLMLPRETEYNHSAPVPVKREYSPESSLPTEQLDQLDLSPSGRGKAGEQIF